MARINQYECNACKTREDAKSAEASQQWVEVKVDAVHAHGDSHKASTVHLCPSCVGLWLKHIGVPTEHFATSIREDNARAYVVADRVK
jgi:hypothetical protein